MRFRLNLPLTLVVIFWGFNFVALKLLYREVDPAAVALIRFLCVWAILAAYCTFQGESLRIPKEDAFRVLLCGFMSMGAYMVPFLEGLKLTAPANCSIILASAPVLTVIFAWIARQERGSLASIIGCGVSFLGVALVIAAGNHTESHDSLLGDLLVFSSAVIWAWSTVLMRPLLPKYSSVRLFTMSLPGALPVLVPYGLNSLLHKPIHHIGVVSWLMFAHVTVLSGVVAFVSFYAGFRQTSAATTTMYQFFIPPTAVLFSWLVLAQPPKIGQLAGLAVVVAGVMIVAEARRRQALIAS